MDSAALSKGRDPHEPYCGECGYQLTGLTESTKCPECGLPIVEVLVRGAPSGGKRFRTKATLFGLPIVDIAFGPAIGERMGRAKGIIALGDVATGGLAVGGRAIGYGAVGGMAVGRYVMGGSPIGTYAIGPGMNSPQAVHFFDQISWFFGSSSISAVSMMQPMLATVGLTLLAALGVGLMAMVGHFRHRDVGEEVFLPPEEE